MEKDLIEKYVKESVCFTELFKKMGLTNETKNYTVVKRLLNSLNINFNHFDGEKYRIDKLKNCLLPKKTLDDVLVEHSTYNRTDLKRRLYKAGLKKHECELCGQGEEWKGKKMGLILDHINGISNDNRLENLRIVCPNCNATLDTHCGKNKKKKLKEFVEKVDLRKVMTTKRAESYLKKRKTVRPNNETLLNDISELGYSGTGRKYGVSDNSIRKWLKK